MSIRRMAATAKEVSSIWGRQSAEVRNNVLRAMASRLEHDQQAILSANASDVARAREKKAVDAFIDRLKLTPERIKGMADGLRDVASQPDPLGEVTYGTERPNGLKIQKVRVPLGVIGIIYEARPNVTADAAGLCLKAGNVVILRGSSETIESNQAVVRSLQAALTDCGQPVEIIQLVTDLDRAVVQEMIRLNDLIDVVIPRGGANLIRAVVDNSRVPVIETGVGNCHIFVDETADLAAALEIVDNAKTQRPAVCNSLETLLVHRNIADQFLPKLAERFAHRVELRGCPTTCRIISGAVVAQEEDWYTEFLDYILAVKVVDNLEEAVSHIQRYSSHHSEAILTDSYANAQEFVRRVDSAAVYVNASTRFTDGAQFGMGAEIGISTQKLHARGPMGLRELTTTKFVIFGQNNIRE